VHVVDDRFTKLVVAAARTQQTNDLQQLAPMLQAIDATLAAAGVNDRPGTVTDCVTPPTRRGLRNTLVRVSARSGDQVAVELAGGPAGAGGQEGQAAQQVGDAQGGVRVWASHLVVLSAWVRR